MEGEAKPNSRFRYFADLFANQTKTKNIVTKYPLVSCMISYNSKLSITVTKKDDREYYIKMYGLDNYKQTFEEKIGGGEKDYIKLKEVEQNDAGDFYCIAYINDGNFRLRTFGEVPKDSMQEITDAELDINKELDLDDHTMPIDNFPDPFITCCFINNDLIYVNLYHTATTTHHCFVYNHKTRVISSKLAIQMYSNNQNFPYKCFYSADDNEVFSFYRQGQALRIPIFDVESKRNAGKDKYYKEQIIDKDLGQMYLVNDKALIARSSSQILCFKQVLDKFTHEKSWKCYCTLEHRGFIYFIKGNKRIQITTDKKIYVYLIDPETFMPKLENVINNFMNCT